MRTCCWQNSITKFVCLSVVLGWTASVAMAGIEPDFLMDSDPELRIPQPVENFNPAMAALWMTALERPEADMQRMAAETIARGHLYGIPDLTKAVPGLERILMADSSHPAARFAAARALIVLESRSSGEKLFEASQAFGADLQELVEPTLAVWKIPAAKDVWIERLKTPNIGHRDLTLAIQGLGIVGEESALDDLLSIVTDLMRHSAARIEAATAAGMIAETGLEQYADRLVSNTRTPFFVNQLCAVRLLARHTSKSARQTLIRLASHEEPVVVAASLQRLNEIDFSLVLPMAELAMQNVDPRVRRQGATAMLRRPAASHIGPLSQLLADPHPGLRRDVCEGLYQQCEQPELDELIRAAALQMLAGDSWQGQEQAALLLGTLKHQSAADRLVELLESTRVEVQISSAWALRKVAVQETIPDLIDQARRQTELRKLTPQVGLDEQVGHLFEALGVMNAENAVPLLLEYVPKHVVLNNRSRGAAIWALGYMNKGTRNSEIETLLTERILDFAPQPLEVSLVKQMSAIGLARMQAIEQAPVLRELAMSENVEIRLQLALGWALRELTGEELPPPDPPTVSPGNWFLEPLP